MKRILFTTFVFVFLLSACGDSSPALQVTDPQLPIEVSAGKEFNIILESNPSTGYHWEVGELDKNVLEFVKKDYASTSDPNLVGGGGLDVWTFKAVNAGEAQITLGYYPPSNVLTEPQQKVTFTVTVK